MKKISLKKLLKEYLLLNGLTLSYCSRCVKIPRTNIYEWMHSQKKFSAENEKKICNFLNGNFLIPVGEVAAYIDRKENQK